ncbi:hypothetical protein BDN72DRAFT_146416 [Pluteus cervinus]|uniref:Uncharacterized protein n=1 Tax=Pluteus cervinus TaxID=181527 RepID=A0ACD3AL79_9AGAR|nr:hypothetical protein BDN72DRAFT_146416 [Pluteus cervinus]
MVTTGPAMATASPSQSSEHERRRRMALERAKVTHLSRQLQLRLQYARLKVEHGWQRQTLNEVENLYFHRSQNRGSSSQPFLSSSPFPIAVASSPAPIARTESSVTLPLSPRSPVSFRVGSSRSTHALSGTSSGVSQSRSDSTCSASTVASLAPSDPSGTRPCTPPPDSEYNEHDPMQTTPTPRSSLRAQAQTSEPSSSTRSQFINKHTILAISSPLRQSSSASSIMTPASTPSRASYPSPRTPSLSAFNLGSTILTSKFGLSSSSTGGPPALTYDSFWSTHTPVTASRVLGNSLSLPNIPVGNPVRSATLTSTTTRNSFTSSSTDISTQSSLAMSEQSTSMVATNGTA